MFKLDKLQDDAINLLKDLISIQSFSFEEDKTATKINNWLKERGVKSDRKVNNIIAYNKYYDQTRKRVEGAARARVASDARTRGARARTSSAWRRRVRGAGTADEASR